MKEWLKSVLNYRSYPKNKTGYPFFGLPCRPRPSVTRGTTAADGADADDDDDDDNGDVANAIFIEVRCMPTLDKTKSVCKFPYLCKNLKRLILLCILLSISLIV